MLSSLELDQENDEITNDSPEKMEPVGNTSYEHHNTNILVKHNSGRDTGGFTSSMANVERDTDASNNRLNSEMMQVKHYARAKSQ